MNYKNFFSAGMVACLLGLSPLALAAEPIIGCTPKDDMTPICGLKGSEDLEVLPGGKQLLVSQSHLELDPSASMAWLPGSIAVLDLVTEETHVLYPLGRSRAVKGSWGDAQCPGEIGSALSPHGIHLSRRKDGRWQLLVVNHGGRESIEMFEVSGRGRTLRLSWRGCVVAPEHSVLNDTVAMPGGGFAVTNMAYGDGAMAMMKVMEAAEHGENTGNVLRWLPGAGFTVVPGSESPAPNGLQTDKTGAYLYVNVSGSHGEIRKLSLATGAWAGAAPAPHPDNISWGEDGRLLVTGLRSMAEIAPCVAEGFKLTCGAAFYVLAVDPQTMTAETLLSHGGPPMGFASVAVQAGNDLYIGSPVGDRILKTPLRRRSGDAQ